MRLFDTHAHLDFPELHDRLDEVLKAASAAGVERIVTIGASRGFESNLRALEIARAHERIKASVGVHPHNAALATEALIADIRELAEDEQVVGIGETGLDYHYDRAPKSTQRDIFRALLRMAQEVKKPVIIHSREAEEDTLELLGEEDVRGGILHCFTGSQRFADALREFDFYISFSGIVTFKSARAIMEVACSVPADRLLVETDSPYLAPVPYRGKKNEPAFVYHTAAAIAAARGEPLEELAAHTTENARRVFGWD